MAFRMRQNCIRLGSKIQVLWHDSKMTTSMMQRCSPRLKPNFEVPGNVLGITLPSDDNRGLFFNAEKDPVTSACGNPQFASLGTRGVYPLDW